MIKYTSMALVAIMLMMAVGVLAQNRSKEVQHSLKAPFFLGHGKYLPNWEITGSTVVTENFVRITPAIKNRNGSLWNSLPVQAYAWEVEMKFRIEGGGKLGADGMALWYVSPRDFKAQGGVFGMRDQWEGLAIFFDTFDNDGMRDNPQVVAVYNDGTKEWREDGKGIQFGGCHSQFRNNQNVKAKIRNAEGFVEVLLDTDGDGVWEPCVPPTRLNLPTGYHLGLTAATGGLFDNHDVFSVEMYNLDVQHMQIKPTDQAKQPNTIDCPLHAYKLDTLSRQWTDNGTFYLDFCGNTPCGNSSICQITPDNQKINYAHAKKYGIYDRTVGMKIIYIGDRCDSGSGSLYRQTRVFFVCDPRADKLNVTWREVGPCNYRLYVYTNMESLCPKNATPTCGSCQGAESARFPCCNSCEDLERAFRDKGWAFNSAGYTQCYSGNSGNGNSNYNNCQLDSHDSLAPLKSSKPYTTPYYDPITSEYYYFDLCGNTPCGGVSPVCQHTHDNLMFNCGSTLSSRQKISTGVQLNYTDGTYCDPARKNRETTVYIHCDPSVITPKLLSFKESNTCEYELHMAANLQYVCGHVRNPTPYPTEKPTPSPYHPYPNEYATQPPQYHPYPTPPAPTYTYEDDDSLEFGKIAVCLVGVVIVMYIVFRRRQASPAELIVRYQQMHSHPVLPTPTQPAVHQV